MSAAETIRMAEASGIRLGVEGADLILDADLEPPIDVVNAIWRHKAEIIELLAPPGDRWTAEDWRALFEERAGIAEHGAGASRTEAETRAYESCVIEWLWRHPPSTLGPERCAYCDQPLGEPGRAGVPFLTGDGGHVWLHDGCHGDWTAQRRAEAVAALTNIGLRPPTRTMTKEPTKAPDRGNAKQPTAPKKQTEKAVTKPYEPTPHERASIEAYLARREETPPAPRMKVLQKGGSPQISPDHPEPALGQVLLMEALGTRDGDFLDGLLSQLANAGTQGPKVDERVLNFMLSVVKGVKPTDEVEAMLAAQMAAVHMAIMTFARRLAHVESIPQQDSAERAFNKLARTFSAQVEALKRYRTGGEQKVTVEHVTVNEGGQAIVGNVTHGGRGSSENKGSSP
jgi:hypothetical protein